MKTASRPLGEPWAQADGLGFREGVGLKAKARQGYKSLSDWATATNIW